MKQFIACSLALVMVLSLAACSKKDEGTNNTDTPSVTAPVAETPTVPAADGSAMAVAQKAMEEQAAFRYSGVLALVHETHINKMAALERTDAETWCAEFDTRAEGIRQEMEQDGGPFTIRNEIGAQTPVENEELTELQDRYEDRYGLIVTEAIKVEYKVFTEYESETVQQDKSLVVILIDGVWYLDLASIDLI